MPLREGEAAVLVPAPPGVRSDTERSASSSPGCTATTSSSIAFGSTGFVECGSRPAPVRGRCSVGVPPTTVKVVDASGWNDMDAIGASDGGISLIVFVFVFVVAADGDFEEDGCCCC